MRGYHSISTSPARVFGRTDAEGRQILPIPMTYLLNQWKKRGRRDGDRKLYRVLQKPSKRQRAQTEKNAENCIDKALSQVEMLGSCC